MSDTPLLFDTPRLEGTPTHLTFGDDGAPVTARVYARLGGTVSVQARVARDMSVHLEFALPPRVGTPADLVFGDTLPVGEVYPPVLIEIAALLGSTVSVSASVIGPVCAAAQARLRGEVSVTAMAVAPVRSDAMVQLRGRITVTAATFYDVRVTPYMDQRAASPHQTALADFMELGSAWGLSSPEVRGRDARWQKARPDSSQVAAAFDAAQSVRQRADAPWQLAVQSVAHTAAAHQSAIPKMEAATSAYQLADQVVQQAASPMQTGIFKALHHADTWQWAQSKVRGLTGRSGASRHLRGVTQISFPWQVAGQAKNGKSRWPLPQPEGPTVYPRDGHLVFECPPLSGFPLHLVFGAQACYLPPVNSGTVVVPILRTYVTINSISLRRVDTGVELHAHGFNMTLDYQSWTWTWSASLHHDAEGHLGRESNGDFAELEAVVNGIPFRLRLERTVCDRRFNPTRWAVSGRGKASVLSGPVMSFGNTVDRTAQQLMADALTVNGASLGWAVDWGLTDWLVPAGAWSLRGSYIDAVNDIATAAGGYVQPHPTDATLRILPRYPVAPWNWGSVAPDFEIPDVAEVEGTEYIDKPGYNKVFVGGVGAGVFGPFKRAGTAGDILAPQVTHALITHADAHRQRGLAELSDTGRQEHITLKMQVLEETGIIMPGQFVRYTGEKTVVGIVRSTTIDWSRPVLRQTIGIETHA